MTTIVRDGKKQPLCPALEVSDPCLNCDHGLPMHPKKYFRLFGEQRCTARFTVPKDGYVWHGKKQRKGTIIFCDCPGYNIPICYHCGTTEKEHWHGRTQQMSWIYCRNEFGGANGVIYKESTNGKVSKKCFERYKKHTPRYNEQVTKQEQKKGFCQQCHIPLALDHAPWCREIITPCKHCRKKRKDHHKFYHGTLIPSAYWCVDKNDQQLRKEYYRHGTLYVKHLCYEPRGKQ